MIRDIITRKWIVGSFTLLISVAVTCFLWYQHVTTKYEQEVTEQEVTETDQLARQWENQKANTDKATSQRDEALFPGETGRKLAEAERKNRVVYHLTEPPKPKGKNLQTGVDRTTTQADTGVSPYGFGPYPEVPIDFPFPVDWEFSGSNANHELMARVGIKLWNQGIETYGLGMSNGLVYPNYIDTVYVRWAETTDDDGNPIQYITDLSGYPPACQRIVANNIARHGERLTMTAADIPSDVTIKLYDEAGIDPYTFLDLPRK